ncbi:Decaprenyl diphosphate synthase [hydrothermal vent metagenome]|uniref:Decaprenyl diphosphate synthase n=1 Tax=hydrothermal vent metagenome TaxID=652676 RepID=A0A3B0T6T5_9ZZZZ
MDVFQAPNSDDGVDQTPLVALVQVTQKDMELVNTMILSRANSHVELVPQLARYLIKAGGKRLRPMLTLVAAKMFSEKQGYQINYAAAVEFMHNATLLHDDVVDESEMRRGQPAARKVWGNQASVLVGDFLLGQAFLMMVETGDLAALEVLSRAAAIIAEGEVLQLSKAGDLTTSEADYEQIIDAKTATLFEAATEVGAMAGDAPEMHRKALARYGRELGLAFQLVDDALDYGGVRGALGKNTGDDLREGKMTLPVIIALAHASKTERAIITAALGDGALDDGVFGDVLAIINSYDGLKITLERAHAHALAAREALDDLPASALCTILADMSDFCVARAY